MKYYTETEIRETWQAGRLAGKGFAVGRQGQSPREAVKSEGWEVIDETGDGMALAETPNNNFFVVADSNGPWAVLWGPAEQAETLVVEEVADEEIQAQIDEHCAQIDEHCAQVRSLRTVLKELEAEVAALKEKLGE
jgi:hypothetical protein